MIGCHVSDEDLSELEDICGLDYIRFFDDLLLDSFVYGEEEELLVKIFFDVVQVVLFFIVSELFCGKELHDMGWNLVDYVILTIEKKNRFIEAVIKNWFLLL